MHTLVYWSHLLNVILTESNMMLICIMMLNITDKKDDKTASLWDEPTV